jgi:hypothetical protein
MVKDAYGVYRPAANSPAINAAAPIGGIWTAPTIDMDGQTRTPPTDIGADETNGAGAITSRPLYGGDVGPAWLTRRTLDPRSRRSRSSASKPRTSRPCAIPTTTATPGRSSTRRHVGRQDPQGPARHAHRRPRADHDAIVEYDVAFHDAGTYLLYGWSAARSGSNSLYLPTTLGGRSDDQLTIPTPVWSGSSSVVPIAAAM